MGGVRKIRWEQSWKRRKEFLKSLGWDHTQLLLAGNPPLRGNGLTHLWVAWVLVVPEPQDVSASCGDGLLLGLEEKNKTKQSKNKSNAGIFFLIPDLLTCGGSGVCYLAVSGCRQRVGGCLWGSGETAEVISAARRSRWLCCDDQIRKPQKCFCRSVARPPERDNFGAVSSVAV